MSKWYFFRNLNNRRTVINPAHQIFFGLIEMTFGLVHASYSLPEWQAVKLTFFAPCSPVKYTFLLLLEFLVKPLGLRTKPVFQISLISKLPEKECLWTNSFVFSICLIGQCRFLLLIMRKCLLQQAKSLAWENSWHFAKPSLFSVRNDVWGITAVIPDHTDDMSLTITRQCLCLVELSKFPSQHDQSDALSRSG